MALEVHRSEWVYFEETNSPPFMHTPLHDLEPLLWMVVCSIDARYFDPTEMHTWQTEHFWRVLPEVSNKEAFLANPKVKRWLTPGVEAYPALSQLIAPITTLVKRIHQAHTTLQREPHKLDRSVYADHRAPREILQCMAKLHGALTEEIVLHPEPSIGSPSVDPEPWTAPIDAAVPEEVKHKVNTDSALKQELKRKREQPHGNLQRRPKPPEV
jgi:hypothetical protein